MAHKSRLFRVATEGATTDGRVIHKDWITQMAKNFDRQKYGARVWLEHYRGIAPDGLFKAYGDVIAVQAREVEDGKLALFAQIEPLPELVAFTKARQKIYTSIEVTPKFADTGEAYLTGLAVTDSPASLGTDILSFAAGKPEAGIFASRKSSAQALISEAVQVQLEFDDERDERDDSDTLGARFKAGLAALRQTLAGKTEQDDSRFTEVLGTLEQAAQAIASQAERHAALQAAQQRLAQDLTTLQGQHEQLRSQLQRSPETAHHPRPPATGQGARVQSDC